MSSFLMGIGLHEAPTCVMRWHQATLSTRRCSWDLGRHVKTQWRMESKPGLRGTGSSLTTGTTLSLIGLLKQFSQIKVSFPQWWGLMSKLSVASVLGYISYQVAGNLKFAGDWNQSFLQCALSNLGSVWCKAVEKMNEVFHTRTCSGSGLFRKKFQVSLIL